MNVLDVGANNGYYSCLLASLGHKVFAFEPMPEFYDELIANRALNEFENDIAPHQLAVSDEDGLVEMNAGLVVSSEKGGDYTTCKVTTLDSWCSAHGLSHDIALVKIDVEGLERKVVLGASDVIELSRPILLVEVAPFMMRRFNDDASALFLSLESKGYKAYQIPYPLIGKKTMRIQLVESFKEIKFSLGINFLFIPSDYDQQELPSYVLPPGYVHYQPLSAIRNIMRRFIKNSV